MKYTSLLFVISVLLLLQACGGGDQQQERTMFRYNQSSGISSLDPAFARDQANIWAVNALYNGLVQLDSDLNVVPGLAKSWTISDDGLTYTFNLRTDVVFHDHELFDGGKGRKLTADDVVYSFSRLMDKAVASPGAWIFGGKVAGNAFVAPNDSTFVLTLLKPFRPMLSILCLQYTYVVPREVASHYGRDFRTNPVGTGPFRLVMWKEDNQMILERNPNYWEKAKDGTQLPLVDGVKVFFIQSKESEYLKFRQGELDFISGIDATTANELLTPEGELKESLSGTFELFKTPYLNLEYLGILQDSSLLEPAYKPLANPKVRQAINYAINRPEMLKYLRNGVGRAANAGVIPYGLPGFNPQLVSGFDYNPDKARKLLAEAGYPDGKGLSEMMLYTNTSYLDMTDYIQKQLEQVGIKVKLENAPPQFQRELMSKGQAAFFRASWIADYPDAESYLSLFYSGNPAPPNYTRFKNAQYDSLYLAALNTNADDARIALYQQMDRLILEQAPVVPLYYDEVLRFVRKGVTGLEPNAMNLLDLRYVQGK